MLVDPDTGREVPPPSAMKIEQDTLTKFKKAIDDALSALDSSPASNTNVSQQTLARAAYGQGFTAADDLALAYSRVHDNLKSLSQDLSDQLTALGIAIEGASKGYANVDQEQVDKLRKLQAQTTNQYDQYQKQHHHSTHDHMGTGGDGTF